MIAWDELVAKGSSPRLRLVAIGVVLVAIVVSAFYLLRRDDALTQSSGTGRLLVQGLSLDGRLFINRQLSVGSDVVLPIGEYQLVVEEPGHLPAEYDVVIAEDEVTEIVADQPAGAVEGTFEQAFATESQLSLSGGTRRITTVDSEYIRSAIIPDADPVVDRPPLVTPRILPIPLASESSDPILAISSASGDSANLPQPSVAYPTQSCLESDYSGAGVTIRWSSTSRLIEWVDISSDADFSHPYHRQLSDDDRANGWLSAPVGFTGFDGVSGSLVLIPDVVYYVRFWDGAEHSPVGSFLLQSCPEQRYLGVNTLAENTVTATSFSRLNPDRNPAHYQAELVSQSGPASVAPGQSVELEAKLRNTGTATWYPNTVNLGTVEPQDRCPGFDPADGWYKCNRARFIEDAVAPGEIATYRFTYTPPLTKQPATYREYFRPVADEIVWLDTVNLFWDVSVISASSTATASATIDRNPAHYQAELVSQSGSATVAPGQSVELEAKLRNIGTATWYRDGVNLGTDRSMDRVPGFDPADGWYKCNRARFIEDAVAPGEIATYRFTYTPPLTKQPATYREYFRPVADEIVWLEDLGLYWDVTVVESVASPTPTPTVTETIAPTNTPSTSTPSETQTPLPPTPVISYVENSCIDSGYAGAGVSVSWLTPARPVTWIDISPDANFARRYHKQVSLTYPALVIENAPAGFIGFDGTVGDLTLESNTVYYVRTWDGVQHSQTATFLLPACPAQVEPDPGTAPAPLPTEPQDVPILEPYNPPLLIDEFVIPRSKVPVEVIIDYDYDDEARRINFFGLATNGTSVVGYYSVDQGVYQSMPGVESLALAKDVGLSYGLVRQADDSLQIYTLSEIGSTVERLPLSVSPKSRNLRVSEQGDMLAWFSPSEGRGQGAKIEFGWRDASGWHQVSAIPISVLDNRIVFSPSEKKLAFVETNDQTRSLAVVSTDGVLTRTSIEPYQNLWQWNAEGTGFWLVKYEDTNLIQGVANYTFKQSFLTGESTVGVTAFSAPFDRELTSWTVDESRQSAFLHIGDEIQRVSWSGQ